MVRQCISPGEDRSHSVYRYTDQIYKIIQWNSVIQHFGPGPADQQKHYDKKLDSSISRTKRVILEKALCNPWEWFCTFTISESKYNRKDLREDRDMTQTELAALLQTTQPQIYRYEAGQRDLPLDKLVMLCRYFNVSADYFLGLPDGMPYGHSKTKKRG